MRPRSSMAPLWPDGVVRPRVMPSAMSRRMLMIWPFRAPYEWMPLLVRKEERDVACLGERPATSAGRSARQPLHVVVQVRCLAVIQLVEFLLPELACGLDSQLVGLTFL